MAYIYDLTDTWNAGGTTFYGIKMNVTNTASASGSKLLSLQVGGSEQFGVDKNGNVGIGTSSPGYRLTVSGSGDVARFTNSLSSAYIALDSGGYSMFTGAGQTGNGIYANATSNYTALYTASTERMRIDSSGNVGIGTTAPGVKLDVIGTVRSNSFTATGTTAFQPQTTMVNHAADATGGYYIFYKGRAGGTTSQSGDALGTLLWYGYDTGNASVATSSISVVQTGAASAGVVPTALIFSNVGNIECMRITNAGNVGIGTSSPSYKLDVSATGNISGQFKTSGSINALYLADSGTTAGTLYIGTVGNDFRVVTGSNEQMRITSAGNLQLGTASLATNATNGFPYIPTCAGTPTGTPTAITGYAPMVVDSTNNKLYVYVGGAWQAMN